MDLQGDPALQRDAWAGFSVVHRAHPIHKQLDALVGGPDFITIPFPGLFRLLDHRRLRFGEHRLAARLIIDATTVARPDICLIPHHFIRRLRDALAAELHPAIHKPLGAGEFVFQRQPEIPVGLRRGQKFVLRIPRRRAPRDGALLHPPRRPALPTGQSLPIKQGHRSSRRSSREQESGQKQEKARNRHPPSTQRTLLVCLSASGSPLRQIARHPSSFQKIYQTAFRATVKPRRVGRQWPALSLVLNHRGHSTGQTARPRQSQPQAGHIAALPGLNLIYHYCANGPNPAGEPARWAGFHPADAPVRLSNRLGASPWG